MTLYRVPALMLLVALSALPQSGAAPKTTAHVSPSKTAAPAHSRPGSPGTSAAKDAEIEKSIRARLAKSKIGKDKFGVHVQGGVATLEGRTDVIQHKGTATRLAKNAGAIQVVNRIEVSQQAKDKAAANLANGRRRAQVTRNESTARSERPSSR